MAATSSSSISPASNSSSSCARATAALTASLADLNCPDLTCSSTNLASLGFRRMVMIVSTTTRISYGNRLREEGAELLESWVGGLVVKFGSRRGNISSIESLEQRVLLAAAITPIGTQPVGALSGKIIFTSGGHGFTADNTGAGGWATQRGLTN